MEFFENQLYHIYNRGNNCQQIFFNRENYLYFLKKVNIYLVPACDILAYCLMPTYFDFLIYADNRTVAEPPGKNKISRNAMSEGIRTLLSSYTQGINKQNSTTGSLFQQNTKARQIPSDDNLFDLLCFYYIHQAPRRANLVSRLEDWEFSSFSDYYCQQNESLCNKQLAVHLLDINMKTFYEDSYKIINDDILMNFF